MIYADYDFYADSYGGRRISAGDFARFSSKASRFMDNVTFGRLPGLVNGQGIDPDISSCCCEIADEYAGYESAHVPGGFVKKSEKIGDYSYTLADGSGSSGSSGGSGQSWFNAGLFEICRTWLDPDLFYCGIGEAI